MGDFNVGRGAGDRCLADRVLRPIEALLLRLDGAEGLVRRSCPLPGRRQEFGRASAGRKREKAEERRSHGVVGCDRIFHRGDPPFQLHPLLVEVGKLVEVWQAFP